MSGLFGPLDSEGRVPPRQQTRVAAFLVSAHGALARQFAFALPAKQVLPFVALGGAIGLVLGGSQALSRSLFSQLIPPGKEGEYFGLYEISDKGTSWLGPLLFGLAYDITRSYRVAIVSLLVFFVVGMALLLAVPMRRAIAAAGNVPPHKL